MHGRLLQSAMSLLGLAVCGFFVIPMLCGTSAMAAVIAMGTDKDGSRFIILDDEIYMVRHDGSISKEDLGSYSEEISPGMAEALMAG